MSVNTNDPDDGRPDAQPAGAGTGPNMMLFSGFGRDGDAKVDHAGRLRGSLRLPRRPGRATGTVKITPTPAPTGTTSRHGHPEQLLLITVAPRPVPEPRSAPWNDPVGVGAVRGPAAPRSPARPPDGRAVDRTPRAASRPPTARPSHATPPRYAGRPGTQWRGVASCCCDRIGVRPTDGRDGLPGPRPACRGVRHRQSLV